MDTLKKACSYCIYQERTQQEVREKLKSWGVRPAEAEEMIAWLITGNYLNEGRYARQFVGGKFRIKKWGRRKILFALKSRGLSSACIREALEEIEEEEYRNNVLNLALRKKETLPVKTPPILIHKKLTEYLLGKGYETDYIREVLELI
ncbi:MAG: recombination regulator RecX [Leadbetterella sp.]|nr:recombination regulator RecX [Leadbetterella sp.]